jgi:AraC-like DNA-binding protein
MPAEVRRLRTPTDYFAGTRSSLELWPEKILCFTRKTRREADLEPLARHHHHRYVLVVPWKEAGEVYVDERRFFLQNGHALLIFPFQLHHGFKFSRGNLLWQFVTFEMKEGAALEALRLHPLRALEEGNFALLSNLARAWNRSDDRDELAPWLALILNRLLNSSHAVKEHREQKPRVANSLMLKINQQCLPYLHQPFGLKELAMRLSMSESYLRACFRRSTGMSLGQHLRRLRLQKAMGMLVQSDLTITQIAERCGFDSVFTFSRSFRQFTGITAREYRSRVASPSFDNRKG